MGGKVTNRKQVPRKPRGASPTKPNTAKEYPDKPGTRTIEQQDPEAAGFALEAFMRDPTANVYKIADEMGMPRGVADGLIRRWKSRYVALKVDLEAHTQDEFRELIEDRLFRVLTNMDDAMIAGATMRDLTNAMDKLMNARQLIRGEPTAIVSVEDRRQMNRVLPLIAQELKRRGITIEGEVTTVEPG